ncbi:MAG: tol-pal system protein YbgF [Betaproteobacteria bacterium]|nr:tol-pal system protein YbgF [Betaproteobacteria bacterium]
MMQPRWLIWALAAVFSVNAAAGVFDEDARRELGQFRKQVEQQNGEIEARFQKLDESIKNLGIIQLLNQIEQLNAEIARLRGQIEVLNNQNEQLVKRQKDFYLDIDTRLGKLESQQAAAPVVTAAPDGATAAGTAPVVSKEQENKAYDVGSNFFKRGDFPAAIRAFETFMTDYAASTLVANAQYWIGISYFNLKDFANARAAQESLLKKYPDSSKAPDALLAIASVQLETNDNKAARNTLEDIIARFPTTEAASKARTRLTSIRK